MSRKYEYTVDFHRRADRLIGTVIGESRIRLDEEGFALSLFRKIPPRASDLLRIALAAYASDRLSQREWIWESGGRREIHLSVTVSDVEFWREGATTTLISDVLQFLSRDDWHFQFLPKRPDEDICLNWSPDQGMQVCLFSGGLDSAAGLATHLRENRRDMVAVTAYHQPGQRERISRQLSMLSAVYGAKLHRVIARTALVKPPELRKQELSQRGRSFLFTALAGAVACAERASEIAVFESGVGALNLPLMRGMETGCRATRSTHPKFLRMMSELVSRIAERPIAFILPHRERTKAEIVRTLAEDGLAELAMSTVSCVHYPVRDRAKQCGYCPACIGRRQAMITAGISEGSNAYQYDLFGEPSSLYQVEAAKLDYLKATLMQVDRLIELEQESAPQWLTQHVVGTGVETKMDLIAVWIRLLLRYRAEWMDIVSAARSKGWRWAEWVPLGITTQRGELAYA